jgi:hypothetical protein
MRDVMNSIPNNSNETIVKNKTQIYVLLKKYFILPLKEGLYGFALVFAVILFVKLLSFLLGINEVFNFDLMDIMLSSVGFFFMFLIYFLKKMHQ